nr:hypothetical protein [uncultured Friedmanniella sp.]
MFVQVIQGQTDDPGALRSALDRWVSDISPGATGFLGSTSGVTDDGTSITLARFDSEDSARTNSDRPEQGAWWDETSKLFTGEVTFEEGTRVFTDLPGDPDQAGFVQIMRGRSSDPDRAFEIVTQGGPELANYRPDILGRLVLQNDDGRFTMAIYFTSEEEARSGERKPPPPEMEQTWQELDELVGDLAYYDLRDPWLYSPA